MPSTSQPHTNNRANEFNMKQKQKKEILIYFFLFFNNPVFRFLAFKDRNLLPGN